jgi:hypothetical protein
MSRGLAIPYLVLPALVDVVWSTYPQEFPDRHKAVILSQSDENCNRDAIEDFRQHWEKGSPV